MVKVASVGKYTCGCRIIHYIENGKQWYSLHGCPENPRGHDCAEDVSRLFDEHLDPDSIVCTRHYRQRNDGTWVYIGGREYKRIIGGA